MKYPHICEKEVMDSIEFYKKNPELDILHFPTTFNGFVERMNNESKEYDDDFEKSLIVYRENKDLLSQGSITTINRLLSDKKIRNKIKIVNDGSYLVNRIWSHIDVDSKIEISPYFYGNRINVDSSEFYKLSIEEQIDWLYDNFDVIYVQIGIVKTRQDILKNILQCERRHKDWIAKQFD